MQLGLRQAACRPPVRPTLAARMWNPAEPRDRVVRSLTPAPLAPRALRRAGLLWYGLNRPRVGVANNLCMVNAKEHAPGAEPRCGVAQLHSPSSVPAVPTARGRTNQRKGVSNFTAHRTQGGVPPGSQRQPRHAAQEATRARRTTGAGAEQGGTRAPRTVCSDLQVRVLVSLHVLRVVPPHALSMCARGATAL